MIKEIKSITRETARNNNYILYSRLGNDMGSLACHDYYDTEHPVYLRNKISFFEVHWDMNCSWSRDQIQ